MNFDELLLKFYNEFAKLQVSYAKDKYCEEKRSYYQLTIGLFICIDTFAAFFTLLIFFIGAIQDMSLLFIPVIFFILTLICIIPEKIYQYYTKNEDEFHWFSKKLKKMKELKKIFITKEVVIDWNLIESLNIKIEKKETEDSTDYYYYLECKFNEIPNKLFIYLGSNLLKELVYLIKDFFEYLIYLNYKCLNCGAGVKSIKNNQCSLCSTKVNYAGIESFINHDYIGSTIQESTNLSAQNENNTMKEIIRNFYHDFENQAADKTKKSLEFKLTLKTELIAIVILITLLVLSIILSSIRNSTFYELISNLLLGIFGLIFVSYAISRLYYVFFLRKETTPHWIQRKLKNLNNKDIISNKNPYFNWSQVENVEIKEGKTEEIKLFTKLVKKQQMLVYFTLENQVKPFEIDLGTIFELEFITILEDLFHYLILTNNPCPNCGSRVILRDKQFCKLCDYDFKNRN